MKLLLLHGAGIASSRSKLSEIKKKFNTNDVVIFDSGSDVQTILGTIATPSLLSQEQLIILENPPEDFTNYVLYSNPYTLILWFDHEVTSKKPILIFVKEKKGEILFFPESREVSVFPLLDNLATGSSKAFLEVGKLKNAGFDLFYFITMIFYLLRNLAATPKNAPPFVKDKLQKQRQKFNREEIKKMYKYILETEFKIKSGLLDVDQAEFLIINKFLT